MNDAIREAGERQAAEVRARLDAEEAARLRQEALEMAAQRSIDLLAEGLVTLAELLKAEVAPEAKFSRRAQRPAEAPDRPFYIPSWSRYSRWYARKQPGWFLTSSAEWDHALQLLGESDLRIAVLANGQTSRPIRLTDADRRKRLAQEIIDCAAKHDLVWPEDGPDLTPLLRDESDDED